MIHYDYEKESKRIDKERGYPVFKYRKKRPNEMMDTAINILKKSKKSMNIDDLVQKLKEKGMNPNRNIVQNSLGYWSRSGVIQRVGYGEYTV